MKKPASASPTGMTLEELARLVGGEVRGACKELLVASVPWKPN
jgi:hypothetical protein